MASCARKMRSQMSKVFSKVFSAKTSKQSCLLGSRDIKASVHNFSEAAVFQKQWSSTQWAIFRGVLLPEKNRLLRPDIEQKALRHRQMSLHCFLTSFVRVARAEQVEKTGRLEEKEEEESLLGGNRQLCPGLWRWWPMCGGSYILVKKWWPMCEGNCILV